MSGNMWEWTSSGFSRYPYDPADGREDQTVKCARAVRGGAWMYSRRLARCSAREGLLPDVKSPTVGFRIAVDAQP
jgi:formylglycine-generating enzyme required for sulfatase activity